MQTWLLEENGRWRNKGGGVWMRCLECVGCSWWIWAGMVRGRGEWMVDEGADDGEVGNGSADRTCDVTAA